MLRDSKIQELSPGRISDEMRDSMGAAIDQAVNTCLEMDLQLMPPASLTVDFLLNVCSGTISRGLRPELKEYVHTAINNLPNLDAQQRECLRVMAFMCPDGD